MLGSLLLPEDVVIVPVSRLAPGMRDRMEHEDGDHCVTRPRSRTTTTVVDARTAALLERFRTPSTIVDAVVAFCSAEGSDPRATLDDAFPVLAGFVREGLLLAAESELARPITGAFTPGDRVGPYEIVRPVHVVIDTEVYEARDPGGAAVALKIARAGAAAAPAHPMAAVLAHEARILRHLDGKVSPALLEQGEFEGRPFLAESWCPGVDLHQAAAELRELDPSAGRPAHTGLAERLIDAYRRLHRRDVLHGDVHPRNVRVAADGSVTLVDFGFAVGPAAPRGGRGGIDFFLEPEVARARLAGLPPPPPTFAGEQYALGALTYLLLTGAHTHDFSLEPQEMLRQVAEQPPSPFRAHGRDGLRAVETVVHRALAKSPRDRYPSVEDLLDALREAAARDLAAPASVSSPSPARDTPGPADRLLGHVLERLAVPGALFDGGLAAPTASVMNGAAGFAYALLRVACLRDDEALLAAADLWSARALASSGEEAAFWNAEANIVPEIFGPRSYYHNVAGVHAVRALVDGARADEQARREAVRDFAAAASQPCEHLDAAFGRAGLLLGCAALLEAAPPGAAEPSLRALGDALRDSVWDELEARPPLDADPDPQVLGAAHGWAGFLYAVLRWSEASSAPPPEGVGERLGQLGALAQPAGRGLWWPHQTGAPGSDLRASWCNGAAGHVPLWVLAHALLGDDRFEHLARGAAWTAYEDRAGAPGDLCCGYAGRAYALLCLHRHLGEPVWLARARALTDRAAASIEGYAFRRESLYKGEIGVALLAAEVNDPAHARMPLFEGEGRPSAVP